MIKVGDRVIYNSTGRPWLRDRVGVVVSVAGANSSVLVQFPPYGSYNGISEWIGVSALLLAESNSSDARKKVMDEIQKLEKQISDLRSRVSKLNHANKALKDLGL